MKRLWMAVSVLLSSWMIVWGVAPSRAADGGSLPVAKNVNVYRANCLSCHSSSYVINLPKTTRDVWVAEVKKMVDLYDAKISPENQALIVDYLMEVRGLPESAAK